MAKLNGPLFSLSASGSIDKELTYSARRAVRQVRFQKKQKDVASTDRVIHRGRFVEAVTKWNSLTAGEKQSWNNFIKGKVAPPAELSEYALWHMNEASGINAADSSGNGRNGTTVNGPSFVPAKLNNGIRLNPDGNNEQSIDFGNIANFEKTQAFSVSVWLYGNTGYNMLPVIGNGNDWFGGAGWLLNVAKVGTWFGSRWSIGSPLGIIIIEHYGEPCAAGWIHIVVTYDGSGDRTGLKVFLDNVDITPTGYKPWGDDSLLGSSLTTRNLFIGYCALIGFTNSLLDEGRIYTKELTIAEIATLWNNGNGTENPL